MTSGASPSILPRVYVIGTGGTISTVGESRSDYTNYSYGNRHLTIQQMLERVPEVNGFAETVPEQLINVGSTEVAPPHWLQLAQRVNRIFRDDPGAAGVAVTHGTATLEETAYFLNLTVRSSKPVVVTGAMRPASGLGDGLGREPHRCGADRGLPQRGGPGSPDCPEQRNPGGPGT